MKFKNHGGVRHLSLKDKFYDKLDVQRFDNDKGKPDNKMHFRVNDGVSVMLSKAKALKLAYAIIDELNPDPVY